METPTGLIGTSGLEFLTFCTPSGYKVSIFLEELRESYGLDYTLQAIDLSKRVQKQPWFVSLNPNGRIPVLVDHDNGGLKMMEGMVMLEYLARKVDVEYKFSFTTEKEKSLCQQWMCFAQSHLGPWTNCAVTFLRFTPEKHLPTILYFISEIERLYGVLDTYLAGKSFLVDEKYSIADVAVFAMVDNAATVGIDLQRWPDLHAWWQRIEGKGPVRKGLSVPMENPFIGPGLRKRLANEPGFKEREEEEVWKVVERAKKQGSYVYASP